MSKRRMYLFYAIGGAMIVANELPGDLRITGLIIGVLAMLVFLATYGRE